MSEEKIDLKKLTRSQVIDAFYNGKVSKKELEDVLDKKDLFKLRFKELEDILYNQKKSPKMFPKELRIKSEDILKEYGRTLSGGQLIRLAEKDYVTEIDLLKALGKYEIFTFLGVQESQIEDDEEKKEVSEKDKENEVKKEEAENIEDKNLNIPQIEISQIEDEETSKRIVDKEDVDKFFSAKKLTEMYFSKKMTKEFVENYQEAFKDEKDYSEKKSREVIDELKTIFKDNMHALYIVMMRLHLKGFVTGHDIITEVDIEFFKEKAFKDSGMYEVLDNDGNVLYRYNAPEPVIILEENLEKENEPISQNEENKILEIPDDVEKVEESLETVEIEETEEVTDEMENIPETENYLVIEPLSEEEIIEAFKDEYIDSEVFKRFFTFSELMYMYKTRKLPVKVFALIEDDKRTDEIIKAYDKNIIHFEEIMELYFYYNAISVKGLKRVIKNLPKRVSLLRYIGAGITIDKVFELYENELIDFNTLTLLKEQEYISEDTYNKIRLYVDKVNFYDSIKNKEFRTNVKVDDSEKKLEEQENNKITPLVEMSDQERILLSKVVGITDEELENISIIKSEDENGNKTKIDEYQIISDSKDGLVIFGKFDYSSPIFVMTFEEAAYFFRNRDEDDLSLIYDDLLYRERFENNSQIAIVEHDENMGTKLLEALSLLSEEAKNRYSNDQKYLEDVKEYIRSIDEKYKELAENNY